MLRRSYGAGPVHLFAMLLCLALTGYAVVELGWSALWDEEVWWQSILVWFLGAVVIHDLVLFPAYALVDRFLVRTLRPRKEREPAAVAPLNYVRTPLLAIGLLTLLFLPGIVGQGASSYFRATGQTQEPFLGRWLLLCAAIVAVSGAAYVVRRIVVRRGSGPGGASRRGQWP